MGCYKASLLEPGGKSAGGGDLKLYVNPSPQLDINIGPPPVLSPSGRGVINITLANTGNCPLTGFFYADHVPPGLTVILPVRLLEIPLDNWVSLRAEVIAAENITPGELEVTFIFNGYFGGSELLPFKENVTASVNVVGEPRLHVGFSNGRGYLLVNQSEVCSVEVFVTNREPSPAPPAPWSSTKSPAASADSLLAQKHSRLSLQGRTAPTLSTSHPPPPRSE